MTIGRVYKITCENENICYIGSTKQPLKRRLQQHSKFGNSSKVLFEYPNVEINLLEEIDYQDRDELTRKEAEYIKEYRDIAVNLVIPFRTSREYYEDNKEYIKQRNNNYRRQNIEKYRGYNNKYYQNNREIIKVYKSIKHQCDCGGKYTNGHRAEHLKTKKHLNFLEQQNQNNQN